MPELRGFEASASGTYVLLEDVIATIREYAQSLDDPNSGAAIHELASWFAAGQDPRNVTAEEPQDVVASEQEHDPAANRIELYPEETPRGIRWYARSVDAEGNYPAHYRWLLRLRLRVQGRRRALAESQDLPVERVVR